MTTDRQREANRENAQKSTGPKSRAGKRSSSRNARKHGLTTRPERALIEAFYRVILDEPDATIDPFETDPARRAALRLAETEAHLQNLVRGEAIRFVELEHGRAHSKAEIDTLSRFAFENPEMLPAVQTLIAAEREHLQSLEKSFDMLFRYRGEAEAQRRKAFKSWLKTADPETKPNTSIG